MENRYENHTIYNIDYHFVWMMKYRYKVLTGDIGVGIILGQELFLQHCGSGDRRNDKR